MISRETIEEVQAKASLIAVAGDTLTFKRQGSGIVALCPFHAEKTPSFHVREDRFFHCFGCGASGNTIGFVMRMKGLSFPEAVEDLAQRLGVTVRYEGGRRPEGPREDKGIFFRANAEAARFYQHALQRLPESHPAKLYIKERGLRAESMQTFALGFASRDRDELKKYLISKGLTESALLQGALLRRNERGEVYDTFRGRIVFPIPTDNKHIVGFGGRVIPALFEKEILEQTPKYLNSPESPVYQKSKVLYGLPQAMSALRETREVYIVEGYLDVISLWQAGVKNVVATCGTALTEQHVRRLKYLVQRVVLLFDGDSAGRAAAGKSFEVFLNSGLDVSCIILPEEHDPDTFAREHESDLPQVMAALPRNAFFETYVDYLIDQTGAASAKELGAAAKGKLAEEILKVLVRIQNQIERADLVERAAFKLGVSAEILRGMSVQGKPTITPASEHVVPEARIPPVEELPFLDREVLRAVMVRRSDLPSVVLKDPDLSPALHSVTLRFISALDRVASNASDPVERQKERIKALLEKAGDSWKRLWKDSYAMAEASPDNADRVLEQCRQSVRRQQIMQEIQRIQALLSQVGTDTERAKLAEEKLTLTRRLNSGPKV